MDKNTVLTGKKLAPRGRTSIKRKKKNTKTRTMKENDEGYDNYHNDAIYTTKDIADGVGRSAAMAHQRKHL
uniref:Uncharacterized protein n=1 Tax=Romanomermis culicivorax TaxID=13658 RepID=A0A915HWX0_ROMCU